MSWRISRGQDIGEELKQVLDMELVLYSQKIQICIFTAVPLLEWRRTAPRFVKKDNFAMRKMWRDQALYFSYSSRYSRSDSSRN